MPNLYTVLALLIALCLSATATAAPSRGETKAKQAVRLFKEGAFEAAARIFEELADELGSNEKTRGTPAYAEVLRNTARCYEKLGDFARAEVQFKIYCEHPKAEAKQCVEDLDRVRKLKAALAPPRPAVVEDPQPQPKADPVVDKPPEQGAVSAPASPTVTTAVQGRDFPLVPAIAAGSSAMAAVGMWLWARSEADDVRAMHPVTYEQVGAYQAGASSARTKQTVAIGLGVVSAGLTGWLAYKLVVPVAAPAPAGTPKPKTWMMTPVVDPERIAVNFTMRF